jgi:hypothetical protein
MEDILNFATFIDETPWEVASPDASTSTSPEALSNKTNDKNPSAHPNSVISENSSLTPSNSASQTNTSDLEEVPTVPGN